MLLMEDGLADRAGLLDSERYDDVPRLREGQRDRKGRSLVQGRRHALQQ